jgi:hypothetical protein
LWPLSDSKTLKSKFDDIFAATRYTKGFPFRISRLIYIFTALDAIRKLIKENSAKIKTIEAERLVLESHLDHVENFIQAI